MFSVEIMGIFEGVQTFGRLDGGTEAEKLFSMGFSSFTTSLYGSIFGVSGSILESIFTSGVDTSSGAGAETGTGSTIGATEI